MAESLLAALRRRKRVDGVADFHLGEIFLPGSGAAVYEPDFSNPIVSLIGAATDVRDTLACFQPTPIYIAQPGQIITGMPNPLGVFEQSGLSEV